MLKSKLLESLRQLSGRQLSRFEEFLSSPYFNKNLSNLLFFRHLLGYAPAFQHPDLEKSRILDNWPLELDPSEKALHNLMSQLNGSLEAFLAVEGLQKDEFTTLFYQLQQSREAGLERVQRRIRRKMDRYLEKRPWRDARFYDQAHRLARLEYLDSDHHQRDFNPELQEAADALDVYYLVNKLRYGLAMAHLAQMLNVRYENHFEEELLAKLARHPFGEIPVLQIYRAALSVVRDGRDAGAFHQLKALLSEHGRLLPPAERKELYTGLLNFCTRRINRFADESFREEYLDLNITLLDSGLLLENGVLSPWRYTNLVAAALRCGREEWARAFLEEQKAHLPPDYAENIYHYNLGYTQYQTGDLDAARQTLARVDFEDVVFNVLLRGLLTRVYYEAGEEELLFSYLEANRLFLLRNDLIEARLKTQMRNFLDGVRRLAKTGKPEAEELPGLRESLPPAAGLMHREWLLRQIERKMRDYGLAPE